MEGEKAPGPKEIPDKFRDDGRLREAYLAGWSDCAAAVMASKPDDAGVQVLNFSEVHGLLRRVNALEEQFRALAGDAADNAKAISEIKAMLTPIDEADGMKSGGQ